MFMSTKDVAKQDDLFAEKLDTNEIQSFKNKQD